MGVLVLVLITDGLLIDGCDGDGIGLLGGSR